MLCIGPTMLYFYKLRQGNSTLRRFQKWTCERSLLRQCLQLIIYRRFTEEWGSSYLKRPLDITLFEVGTVITVHKMLPCASPSSFCEHLAPGQKAPRGVSQSGGRKWGMLLLNSVSSFVPFPFWWMNLQWVYLPQQWSQSRLFLMDVSTGPYPR